jgi:surface antigen
MEREKIDRVIDAFRSAMYHEFSVNEEGMVANPPGGSGGFSASSDAKGPTAGYDKPMKFDGRNKFVRKAISDLMSRKDKREKRKGKKKALEFNPYFKSQDGRSS